MMSNHISNEWMENCPPFPDTHTFESEEKIDRKHNDCALSLFLLYNTLRQISVLEFFLKTRIYLVLLTSQNWVSWHTVLCKCPTALMLPCTTYSMVLQECTSAVGISKKKSTTQESWRAKGLEDATCVVGFDGVLRLRLFQALCSSSLRVFHLSLSTIRILQSPSSLKSQS
jgi:hypothetical protein